MHDEGNSTGRRWLRLTLIVWLAGAAAASAQDVFSSNSNSGHSACEQTYSGIVAQLNQDRDANNKQLNQDLTACGSDQSCHNAAIARSDQRARDDQKKEIDATAQRDNCVLKVDLAGDLANAQMGDCEKQYAAAIEALNEKSTLNVAQYQKDFLDCQGDQNCQNSARERQDQTSSQIQKERDAATTARNKCTTSTSLKGGATQTGQTTSPGGNASQPIQGGTSTTGTGTGTGGSGTGATGTGTGTSGSGTSTTGTGTGGNPPALLLKGTVTKTGRNTGPKGGNQQSKGTSASGSSSTAGTGNQSNTNTSASGGSGAGGAGNQSKANNPASGGSGAGSTGTQSKGTGPASKTPNNASNQNPSPPPLDYLRGFADGLSDCFKGFMDLAAAVAMIAQGHSQDAATILGVKPGQDPILQMIAQEIFNTKVVGSGVSAYQQGRVAGRRVCAYGLVPGVAKAGKGLLTPGVTRLNPLKGQALYDAMGDVKNLPKYTGRWVSIKEGTIQLGDHVGDGSFSSVFERVDQPGKVVKIGSNPAESPGSFTRQIEGSNRLTEAGVSTPKIYPNWDAGTSTTPGSLTTDNVLKNSPPGTVTRFVPAGGQIAGTAFARALQDINNKLIAKGYVLIDNHLGNIAFELDSAAGVKAIVVDPDMVMTASEIEASAAAGTLPGNIVANFLSALRGPVTAQSMLTPGSSTASSLSANLFVARGYSAAGPTLPK